MNLNLLRDHILNQHHALVMAFAASQGIADLTKAAWRLVDEAKMPRIPPQVERLDAKWAILDSLVMERD